MPTQIPGKSTSRVSPDFNTSVKDRRSGQILVKDHLSCHGHEEEEVKDRYIFLKIFTKYHVQIIQLIISKIHYRLYHFIIIKTIIKKSKIIRRVRAWRSDIICIVIKSVIKIFSYSQVGL